MSEDTENRPTKPGILRIENNTDRHIILPPLRATDASGEEVDFPRGVRLLPGLNTVPRLYMDVLVARETKADTKGAPKGAPKVRYPGRVLLAQLQEPVDIVTINGRKRGPQITIYEPDQVADREDGPVLPADLRAYGQRAALELIKAVSNVQRLRAWAGNDNREVVQQAATAKLMQLGG